MQKRLTAIRRGIRYQDLVAAEALLDMVNGCTSPPLSVRLEDRRGGSFDDVVLSFHDRVVWKQVKWAQNPGSEPLTIDSLCAKKRRSTPLISKLAKSLLSISADGFTCELEFVTNRSADTEFQRCLSGKRSKIKRRLNKSQQARLNKAWRPLLNLDDSQYQQFLQALSFLVNSPNIVRLERDVRNTLRLMGCNNSSFEVLMDAIWQWAQDDNKEAITRDDVEHVLKINHDIPSNEFVLPARRIDRSEMHQELGRRIENISSGYLVLLGSPGSGKSTILNTLQDGATLKNEDDVIVYNCFTGTADNFLRTRARADNFAQFLARALYELYSTQGRLAVADATSIERLLNRAGASMRSGKKLVLVVDGLDYAKRFAPSNVASVFDNLPPTTPENVVVLVSAQTKLQLPSHLQQLDEARYLFVPPFDRAAVKEMLSRCRILERTQLKAYEQDDLCHKVYDITSGHALHVNYVARQLEQAVRDNRDVFATLADIPSSGGDIEVYYRLTFAKPTAALSRDALKLMATCPFALTASEVGSLLSPPADRRTIEDALNEFAYLFERIGEHYYFTHDSIRVFADTQLAGEGFTAQRQIYFLTALDTDPRVGDHLLNLLAEEKLIAGIPDEVNCDWLARQIAAGANTQLLHESLEGLALSAIEKRDMARAARFCALKSCLERAQQEGELYEATLVNAWLALDRVELIERYVFVSSHFLSRIYPGPDLIDLAEDHKQFALAERMVDRLLTQSEPAIDRDGLMDDFESFLRHLARRKTAKDVFDLISARVEKIHQDHETDEFPPTRTVPEQIAEFSQSAAFACLDAGQLDKVDEWLRIDPSPFADSVSSELYLRMRLKSGDFVTERNFTAAALGYVENEWVLSEFATLGTFDDEVRSAIKQFHISPLFADRFPWYDHSQVSHQVTSLYYDVTTCSRLSLKSRLETIKSAADHVQCYVAREFLRAIINLAELVAAEPTQWSKASQRFVAALPSLRDPRRTSDDVRAAQSFVGCLGSILGPVAAVAKRSGEEGEFSKLIEDLLMPALRTGYMSYESGQLSIADMLQDAEMCNGTVRHLLAIVEDTLLNSIQFKSGSLINLAARYAKAGDKVAAERNLVVGVRAAFTYGYRKDTTLNEFISAFEAVAPHIPDRFDELVDYITRVIMLLDELTDGRMLYYASSHFIAFVCEHDIVTGASLAQMLWTSCRQLRPHSILMAAKDRGIDITALQAAFEIAAPDVELSPSKDDDDSNYDPRDEFVVSDKKFSGSESDVWQSLSEIVSGHGYGAGLHSLPGLVRYLVANENVTACIQVFSAFEAALRELLSPYPLPALDEAS
jgi:hypothetical protein